MNRPFEAFFNPLMQGERPQDPPEGGILAHEEFVHPLVWSHGDEMM